MQDLIEKLEKAAAPGRELDGLIFRAVDERPGDRWELFDVGEDGAGVWYRECRDEKAAYIAPQFYTSSLDAALFLVPGDHRWYVADSDHEDRPVASVFRTDDMLKAGAIPRSVAATPALALCIAALKARSGQ